jgi:hypothetical protein
MSEKSKKSEPEKLAYSVILSSARKGMSFQAYFSLIVRKGRKKQLGQVRVS